jgi:hypothetical protein
MAMWPRVLRGRPPVRAEQPVCGVQGQRGADDPGPTANIWAGRGRNAGQQYLRAYQYQKSCFPCSSPRRWMIARCRYMGMAGSARRLYVDDSRCRDRSGPASRAGRRSL